MWTATATNKSAKPKYRGVVGIKPAAKPATTAPVTA
jgi:hypothetical protein